MVRLWKRNMFNNASTIKLLVPKRAKAKNRYVIAVCSDLTEYL